jgi:hypothetical protein
MQGKGWKMTAGDNWWASGPAVWYVIAILIVAAVVFLWRM